MGELCLYYAVYYDYIIWYIMLVLCGIPCLNNEVNYVYIMRCIMPILCPYYVVHYAYIMQYIMTILCLNYAYIM